MDALIENERAARLADGMREVSLRELLGLYEALGYRFDRSCAARGIARYMAGKRAGGSYPCRTLYPVQSDNGLSAYHVAARRDTRYDAFRVLRNTVFAVSRGRIVEV